MFWLGEVSEMEFELFATTLTDLIRLMSAAHLTHVFCRHLKELVISSRVTNVSISFMDINLFPWQIKDIIEKNIIYKSISVVWNHIVGQQLTCKFRIVWKKSRIKLCLRSGGSLRMQNFFSSQCSTHSTDAHSFYRFCRTIEWNLEACSPLWLRIWIQMCLSQVVNFLCTQLRAANKKKAWKKTEQFLFKICGVSSLGGKLW